MFGKKKRVEAEKMPLNIKFYPVGAVAYVGGDEIYFIELALAMALQMYESLRKIKPKQAKELVPAAEMWVKLMQKNAAYLDEIQNLL